MEYETPTSERARLAASEVMDVLRRCGVLRLLSDSAALEEHIAQTICVVYAGNLDDEQAAR